MLSQLVDKLANVLDLYGRWRDAEVDRSLHALMRTMVEDLVDLQRHSVDDVTELQLSALHRLRGECEPRFKQRPLAVERPVPVVRTHVATGDRFRNIKCTCAFGHDESSNVLEAVCFVRQLHTFYP